MKASSEFVIENKTISNVHPVYFIADIAANHDGDLERAKDLIYLAAESGADAAKFQHFQAKTIVSDHGFKTLGGPQSHQEKWNKSVYEVYKDASVNLDWTESLKETCRKANVTFFTTPYSLDVIEHLNKYVPAYKIGSGDITWTEMIQKVANQNKPYILASGASTCVEVFEAVKTALAINPMLCLMQCNTNYTASLENFKFIQLKVLKTYRNMFPELVLGLSDHTPGHSTVLGAVALGARMIEKHFTDDTSRVGPDHAFSMDPRTWHEMVDRTRELEYALGNGIKKVEDNEKETVLLQRRSLRAVKDLPEGSIIRKEDFEALRPCPSDALPPSGLEIVVGKKIIKKIQIHDYLKIGNYE